MRAPQPGDDWMTTLLQTQAFRKVPPANIQAIFMRMQRMDYRAGEVVIKQGDVGDYFYVVVKGTCTVTRGTPLNKEGIKLAELKMGDTFGEEALISEAKRNADGHDDDRRLSDAPRQGRFPQAVERAVPAVGRLRARRSKIVAVGRSWVDVRLPSEFEHYHVPNCGQPSAVFGPA